MTVALAGSAPATFEIKSANLPLVSLLLKSPDLVALSAELKQRFGDMPDFFDSDPLVLDLSPLQAAQGIGIDYAPLLELLRSYKLMPVAVRGGNAEQMRGALAAGLAPAAEAVPVTPKPESRRAAAPQPAPAPSSLASALVVDRPLRSGQQVYARGRDLVVFSMVNPGAEVIADGHIHVYAPLRGKAIAGARGNIEARIVALCLEPELLSIAGIYRTSEVPLPGELLGKPALVRLAGGPEGKLVMEPLKA